VIALAGHAVDVDILPPGTFQTGCADPRPFVQADVRLAVPGIVEIAPPEIHIAHIDRPHVSRRDGMRIAVPLPGSGGLDDLRSDPGHLAAWRGHGDRPVRAAQPGHIGVMTIGPRSDVLNLAETDTQRRALALGIVVFDPAIEARVHGEALDAQIVHRVVRDRPSDQTSGRHPIQVENTAHGVPRSSQFQPREGDTCQIGIRIEGRPRRAGPDLKPRAARSIGPDIVAQASVRRA